MYTFLLLVVSTLPPMLGEVLLADASDTTTAKAVITDQFGNPVPLTRDSAVGLMVFSAKKSVHGDTPSSVKWTIRPEEYDSRKWVPSDNNLEVGVALEGQPVTLTIILSVSKGDTVDHLVLDVKCGKGGQPPPIPPKPDPKPNPKPKPDPLPVVKQLRLVVVEDSFNRLPSTAAVLNDRKFWDGLKLRGHSYEVFSENDTTPLGKSAVAEAKVKLGGGGNFPVGGVYVLIKDAASNQTLEIWPLPANASDLNVAIAKYVGGK